MKRSLHVHADLMHAMYLLFLKILRARSYLGIETKNREPSHTRRRKNQHVSRPVAVTPVWIYWCNADAVRGRSEMKKKHVQAERFSWRWRWNLIVRWNKGENRFVPTTTNRMESFVTCFVQGLSPWKDSSSKLNGARTKRYVGFLLPSKNGNLRTLRNTALVCFFTTRHREAQQALYFWPHYLFLWLAHVWSHKLEQTCAVKFWVVLPEIDPEP